LFSAITSWFPPPLFLNAEVADHTHLYIQT
jgi:hypothetical protein